VLGACGGAVLYRQSMLDRIGLFDEDFSLIEDVDLGLRAQSAGYKFCIYLKRSVSFRMWHTAVAIVSLSFVFLVAIILM